MIAAIAAKKAGRSAEIFEKNEKLGKKLFITGKGRCNVTNACESDVFFKNVVSNPKFLYSAFKQFDNREVMDFFENAGVPLKTERGMRVFPESDKSSDIIKGLKNEIEKLGIPVFLNREAVDIFGERHNFTVKFKENGKLKSEECDSVIIATGGMSYRSTGSTGDGYRFAKVFGHSVTELYPALCGLETLEEYPKELQGLTLKNVTFCLKNQKGKKIYDELGEMLFTHFGISGPLVLSASSVYAEKALKKQEEVSAYIDLKPAINEQELDARVRHDFEKELNKAFKNSLDELLPKSMIPVFVRLSGIDPEKKVNSVTQEERQKLVKLFKELKVTITGLRSFDEAIITKGGVNVKEIDPKTMESKIVPGLYFAGEVLDLDAFTGGFNLQIAWSTGYAAGVSC